MSLVEHAKRELELIGYDLNDSEEGPNKWIVENILELIEVFSNQGHSGFSAPYCIEMFASLAKYENLSPLTGNDDEWNDVWDGQRGDDGKFLYQNNRCSHVFKDENGCYDIDGKVFKDQNGCCFTSKESRVYIESFPYTPKTEYVDVVVEYEEDIDREFNSNDLEVTVNAIEGE